MRRRELLLGAAALGAAAPFRGWAQDTKARRIGLMMPNAAPGGNEAFRKRLAGLGWVEGRNLLIESRNAEERSERFSDLAKDLVAQKVEVIVTASTPGALAAKAATSTIPVVFSNVADPVATGMVASLARPGGNITGLTSLARAIVPKQLELLKELMPRLERVAYMRNPSLSLGMVGTDLQDAARRAGLSLVVLDAATAAEIDAAFAKASRERATAMIVPPASVYTGQAAQIAQLARQHRIATAHQVRSAIVSGGLVSYGIDNVEQFARTAVYVDKILRGAKPGDLPVEQADRFETFINRSTAKALGITIPQSVLVRVDEVIE